MFRVPARVRRRAAGASARLRAFRTETQRHRGGEAPGADGEHNLWFERRRFEGSPRARVRVGLRRAPRREASGRRARDVRRRGGDGSNRLRRRRRGSRARHRRAALVSRVRQPPASARGGALPGGVPDGHPAQGVHAVQPGRVQEIRRSQRASRVRVLRRRVSARDASGENRERQLGALLVRGAGGDRDGVRGVRVRGGGRV